MIEITTTILAVAGALLLARRLRVTAPWLARIVPRSTEATVGFRRLELITRCLLCLICLWVIVVVLTNPGWANSLYAPAASGYNPPIVLALLVVLVLGASPFMRACRRLSTAPRRRLVVGVIATAVLVLAAQLVVTVAIGKTPGYDPGFFTGFAYGLVNPEPGAPKATGDPVFWLFPNNLFIGYLLVSTFRVLGFFGIHEYGPALTGLLIAHAIMLYLGAVLTVDVIRRVVGATAAIATAPLVILFVVFSPHLNTPYTDTTSLVCCIAMVWLLVALRPYRRSLLGSLWRAVPLGAMAGLASLFKPTTVFVVIGLLVTMLIADPPRPARRRLGSLASIAAVVITALLTRNELLHVVQDSGMISFDLFHNPFALPFSHFMAMGATGTGGYENDGLARTTAIQPPSARAGVDLDLWFTRVTALGPFGYATFLGQKQLWTMADGTFFQGQEGDGSTDWISDTPLSAGIRSVFLNGGENHVFLASVWQAAWLAVLIAVGVALWRRTQGDVVLVVALRCSILLLLAFQLLSESRSRYIYLDVPLFLILAAITLQATLRHRGDSEVAEPQGTKTRPRLGVRMLRRARRGIAPKPAAAITGGPTR